MKLHLPTRLRAAVLACFAVVTSFTTTLATGALAGGAFVITAATLVAPHAEAANYTWTNTGTSESCMSAGPWTAEDGTVLNSWNSGDNQVSPMISSGANTLVFIADTDTETYNKQLKYTFDNLNIAGITVSEGATGYVVRAAGGNRQFVWNTGTYTFHEDFTWKTADATNTGTMQMRGAQTWNIDDGNTVTLNSGSHAFNFQPGQSAAITQNGGTVQLEGSGVINGSGSYTVASGELNLGGRTVSGGSFTTTGGTIKNGTFAAGGKLAVGASPVNVGDITFSDGTLDLSGATLSSTALLNTSGTVSFGNTSKIELGDVTALSVDTEYTVLSAEADGWAALTAANFTQDGYTIARSEVEMTSTGFKFTSIGTNYTDMSTAGTQNWNYTDAVWNTAQDSSDSPIAFASGDAAVLSANADLTLQSEGIVARSVIISGDGTNVSLTSGHLQVLEGVEVQSGATLHLNSNYGYGGSGGYIDGTVTVKNGGTLQLNANDVTGWGGSSRLSVLTIEEGGKLLLSFGGNHETFQGTLNLDGSIEDDSEESGVGAWYMHNGNSSIVTGNNKNASISSNLKLGRNNAPITVGSGSTLTVSGALLKESGNGIIAKNGAGELKITTASHPDTIGYKIGGGTLSFTNGATVGTIEMSGGNTNLLFAGESKTYTTGAISFTSSDNYNRNVSVNEGVTVTVAANDAGRSLANNYGMGTLRVDGEMNLSGELYMGTSSNDSTANNLITGTGAVNVASLTTGNVGTYNFSVNELNVSGHTQIGSYANFLGGTTNLNGTSGYFIRTTIDGGTLNLVGVFRSNTNGAIYVNSGALNIKSTATSPSDDTEQNFDNTIQVLHVAKGAAVTVDTGAVATIASATIAAPIVNKGSLTLSGTLTVSDLKAFTPTTASGTLSYVDADGNTAADGYLSGERKYTLIANTGTLNDDAISEVSGVEGTYENGVLTVTSTDESVFYVNTAGDGVDAVALGEGKKYCINGGTLDVGTDAANILTTAVGDDGIIKLTTNATLGNGAATVAECKLAVSGATLTLGQGKAHVVDISSFSSMELDNATIAYHGANTTFNNVSVTANGANISIEDMKGDYGACDTMTLAGTTTLSENGTLAIKSTNWKYKVNIEALTGNGNISMASSSSHDNAAVLTIDSFSAEVNSVPTSFGGTITVTKNTGSATLNATIDSAVSSAGLNLVNGAVANMTIQTGGSWSGAVNVTGTGNALTSSAGGMNLSQLKVAENAALDLGGSVSALLMNQAGTVDIADMLLTDGAVLTYGDAANLLNVTDGMLTGNVVIGTGLTLTDSGVDLGLSSAIEQSKIGISNYTNGELLVVGDTWHLKSAAAGPSTLVRYYWEGDTDSSVSSRDFWADSKWSTTDDATSGLQTLPGTLDNVVVVFSNAGTDAANNTMILNGAKTVAGVEVINGYYRFTSVDGNNGSLISNGDLVLGSNGHLTQDLRMQAANLQMAANSSIAINKEFTLSEGGDVIVSGADAAIELGNGQNLTADALDLSTAGASLSVSGAGYAGSANTVTLSSISLGEGSGLSLKAGTSNVTVAASALALGANATISVEAGQVLDLTSINYTGENGSFADLINASAGAGIIKAAAAGSVVLRKDSQLQTNLEMTALELNSWRETNPGKKIDILTNGSLDIENTLIIESTAAVNVMGGSLSAGQIKLGHTQGGYFGYLSLSSGSITTSGIIRQNSNDTGSTFTMSGGTLDITGTAGIGTGIGTTITGGTLKASGTDGWGVTGASVGGAAVTADSTGKVTLTNTTITGNITGNGKLVLSGTAHATANATVSGAAVGGITVTTTDANKLTLNNATISSALTNNNGSLELSGTQNVTLDGTNSTHYADVYGSTTYGDNGYKSVKDVYTLVSGTAATEATGTTWQIDGTTVPTSALSAVSFDGHNLTVLTEDAAGKVYYINSGSVEYKTGAGCSAADKLQLTGGKLVMSKELDTAVTTGGIAVTGSSTTLELNAALAADKVSLDTGAATVLMGTGTLNLGTGTSLASGITLGTETDAKWTGTVKVAGTALTDANLSGLGVSGSTIELDDTDGSLMGGTYAAEVLLSNGSELTLGANNAFNGGLDATAGTLSIAGKNSISTLTLADGADLGINLAGMGLSTLKDIGTDAILTVGTLDAAGGTVNLKALAGDSLLLTMSDGQSITLADITTCNATLGLLIGSSTSNVLEVEDANGFTYTYTLTADDTTGHKLVTVTARLNATGWVGDTADTWKSSDTVGGTDANWAGAVGGFYGFGSGTVNLDAAGVTAGDVIVSATTGTTAYTFEGGALSADTLAVNAGSLVLNNESVSTTTTAQVSDSAGLTVNAGKKLTVGTDMAVLDTAELTNNGSIKVTGTLSVDKTATVTNNGTLEAGSINASGATIANSGTLTTGGGTIGKLTGEGSLTNSGTLTIESTEETTLGTLTNSGTLNVGGDLTVKTAVTTGGTVNAANVTVNGDAAFTSLTTGKLTASSLTVKDATITTLDTDKLTVSDKGAVKVTSATTLSSLSNKGSLEVTGDLTLTAPVTAGGTVNAANVTVNGDAAFTSLTTGTLKASSLTVKDAAITTLDTDKLTVQGGTVAVTNGVTLTALTGTGTLDAADKVKLTQAVSGKVNVETPEIELATCGSSLGVLTTDAVTMTEGTTLSTETVLLTVSALNTLSGDTISLDVSESAYAALSKLADGRYTAGDYLLIDGATSADMFTYANGEQLDSIIATGMNAGLTVNDGVLSLSITEITDENGEVVGMVWDTTGGNTTTNNGVEVDTDDGFYKALDYVKQVVVTEDVTFDLAADSVGDSVAGNASDPVAGLLIRNLSGGGELTIKGNAAAQDVATLMNTPGRKITAVALTADAATVNLGLPKGAEGYLVSDLSSTGPTLKSLSLVNRSAVNVNINTEVQGDTDVADYARLSVKEGNILTTGMLSGTDEAEIGGVITVRKGGVYTGSYDEATLVADSGSNLRLRTGGRRSMSLVVNGGGQTTLDSAGQDGSMDFLRVGESPMARTMSVGSATLNLLNTTATDDGIRHSTITLTSDEGNYINKSVVTLSLGAAETARTLSSPGSPVVIDGPVDVTASSIVVNMLGNSVKNGVLEVNTESDKNLTLARFVTGGNIEGNTVTLTGTPEMAALLNKYYTNARLDSKGNIKVDRVTDYYGSRMQLSDNARVGIDMADAALVKLNPQANRSEYAELAGVLDSLDAAVATGNSQAADELGAAVSGASVAALGAAVAGDVERQLMGIRNRTTTMGVDQTQVNENMPYFNAWINAEGDFRRLDEDGTAAGYELSSWGGTVGFDVDMTPRLTMGLAATAMYGDFTAKSADHAEGDLDTYYVTAFARYAANRWSHTFVATAGMADTTLKRTVTHANGSYSAEGDAEAISFGFLYELGYVVAMNESATACLQPVFNVMLAHSSLDGYSEEGRDAALKMGGVDMTTVTFGMGARAQAIMGTNLYNRSSMVEGRALLKVRTGDTEAEAENALGAIPGAMGSVKAAEMGTIGAELGVGLTVPMGATGGSIFADASLEVGSGYTNINGTVGYRINF